MGNTQKIAILVSALLAVGMWLYVGRVLVPHQKAEAARLGIPRGNLSDLYPRWVGSRELLMNHRDPYSPDVTREIQTGYYGRPIDPGGSGVHPNDPRDQQAFAYPVYVAFLLAPTVKMLFPEVQEAFRWLLAGLTILSVLLWMQFVKLRLSLSTAAIAVFLTLGTFAVVQGIRLQQLSLLVAAIIAAGAYLLVSDWPVLAGILLAFSTIKPQLSLPLAGWLLLWALSEARSRRKFPAAFGVTLITLIGGAEYFLPGWLAKFHDAIIAYRQYTGAQSVLDQLATPIVGVPLTGLVVAVMTVICWRGRKDPADGDRFCWITCTVLATTVLIIPTTAPYNQILLLPGVLLMLRNWSARERVNSATRLLRGLAIASVGWPWISATSLAVISVFTSGPQNFWGVPLWTSLFIPLPIAACLAVIGKSSITPRNGSTE